MKKTPYEKLQNKLNECNKFFNKNTITDRKSVIRDIMINYVYENHNQFFKIEGYTKGVYFIEDFYIGRTSNIHRRLSYHIVDSLDIFLDYNSNLRKCEKIIEVIKNNILVVKMLSKKETDEEKLIIEYSNKYDLTNIDFNPNRIKVKRVKKERVKVRSEDLDLKIDDIIKLDEALKRCSELRLGFNKMSHSKTKRYLYTLKNIKTKRIGVFTSKSKYSAITTYSNPKNLSSKMSIDYNKYGYSSFELHFIESDDNYKETQMNMIQDLLNKDFEIYNHNIKLVKNV